MGVVTRAEIIAIVAAKLRLPEGRTEKLVCGMFDAMMVAIQRGEGVEIRGFGSFTVREYRAYRGRNPRTGQAVNVLPKRLPFFKTGKELRKRINGILPGTSSTDRASVDGGGRPGSAAKAR